MDNKPIAVMPLMEGWTEQMPKEMQTITKRKKKKEKYLKNTYELT